MDCLQMNLRTYAGQVLVSLALGLTPMVQAGWLPKILSEGKPYLPDYSYAGRNWGTPEQDKPAFLIKAADFGVKPDDGQDDTAALAKALAAAQVHEGPVSLVLPAGRIVLKDVLQITRSDLTLAGAGLGNTVIEIPVPLRILNSLVVANWKKEGQNQAPTSPFSWAGGFLAAGPPEDFWKGSMVGAKDGKRGGFRILVDGDADWTPGQTVEVRWHNREGKNGSFLGHLFGLPGLDIGEEFWKRPDNPVVKQFATVRELKGRELTLVEPLLHDIRREWSVKMQRIAPLTGIILGGFSVLFPDVPYAGHHREDGYNGIFFEKVAQSEIRDVEFVNPDAGVILDDSLHCTLTGLRTRGREGHYSVALDGGSDNLVRNFEFRAPAIHNPSFDTGANSSVYSHGLAENARLDQHNGANHQNLFDDMELKGDPVLLFEHGGSDGYRPTAGAYNTFWNLRVLSGVQGADLRPQPLNDAPLARIIGLTGDKVLVLDYGPEAYIEGLNQPDIAVPSLYDWQLRRRQAQSTAP